MAKYQVYIDQNFLVIQECENDGTTTVGLAVNEPAKNVSVSAKVDGGTTKYFFTDKTTGRTIAGGIAVDDMFSDTSGTTYADEAAFIAFYRAQLGKSSAGDSATKRIYRALLTQVDEENPSVNVFENNLGFTPLWERAFTGTYGFNLTGVSDYKNVEVYIGGRRSSVSDIVLIKISLDYDLTLETYQTDFITPPVKSDGLIQSYGIDVTIIINE